MMPAKKKRKIRYQFANWLPQNDISISGSSCVWRSKQMTEPQTIQKTNRRSGLACFHPRSRFMYFLVFEIHFALGDAFMQVINPISVVWCVSVADTIKLSSGSYKSLRFFIEIARELYDLGSVQWRSESCRAWQRLRAWNSNWSAHLITCKF
jgi:hypothetical protein